MAKTFQKDGHWIEKTKKTEIFECTCGKKYIQTRANQKTCIMCMYPPKVTS